MKTHYGIYGGQYVAETLMAPLRELEAAYEAAKKDVAFAREFKGILHDYVTYDWHVPDPSHRLHGFRHPGFAVTNSRKITELSALEENMIRRHMWPLTVVPPKYKEAWALTLVDKVLATRETLRKYQKH